MCKHRILKSKETTRENRSTKRRRNLCPFPSSPSLQLVRQKKGGVKLLRNGKVFLIEKRDLWLWKKDFFWAAQIVFLQEWSFFNKNLSPLPSPVFPSFAFPRRSRPITGESEALPMLITAISELAEKMAQIGPCPRHWDDVIYKGWCRVVLINKRMCEKISGSTRFNQMLFSGEIE